MRAQHPSPHVRRITVEEYLASGRLRGTELIDGEIVDVGPASGRHGLIASRLDRALGRFVEERKLGEVLIGEAGFVLRRDPDMVRAPDVAFLSRERLPDGRVPDGFILGAPDLAVEVVSPSDRWTDVEQKVFLYLSAGAREVWAVDPESASVRVYTTGSLARLVRGEETLASDLLPGFALPLGPLFA